MRSDLPTWSPLRYTTATLLLRCVKYVNRNQSGFTKNISRLSYFGGPLVLNG